MKIWFWLITLLLVPLACTFAQQQPQAFAKSKTNGVPTKLNCTNMPCSNTATGEDPSDITERAGPKILQDARAPGSVRDRWELTPLYSSSKKPERLTLMVIKASGFSMSLDPHTGYLKFNTNEITHTFDLATNTVALNNLCPRYAISVVDAGSDYAVIKNNCFIAEYAPGRFHQETEYFFTTCNHPECAVSGQQRQKTRTLRATW